MKKRNPFRWLLPLVAAMVATPTGGQDIVASWEAYLSAQETVTKAQEKLDLVEREADLLQEEIASLQEKHSWYARWLIKMRLARKSVKAVQLSDSLRVLRARREVLEKEREAAFDRLIEAYAGRLRKPEGTGELTGQEKEIGVSLVRVILSRERDLLEFPHYGFMLEQEFADEEVKAMVLADLKKVVSDKLKTIDSLLTEKRSEQELIRRVTEFHAGLRIQSEAEFDPGTASGAFSRTPSPSYTVSEDGFAGAPETGSGGEKAIPGGSSRGISSYEKEAFPIEGSSAGIPMDPLEREISRLERARREYRDLLGKIGDELGH
ncbi:MAG: hypothetical protein ACE5LH_09685 [Fidelibacterota bacterium]